MVSNNSLRKKYLSISTAYQIRTFFVRMYFNCMPDNNIVHNKIWILYTINQNKQKISEEKKI